MNRKLQTEDLPLLEKLTGKELVERDDIIFDCSGISIENEEIQSAVIVGKRSITQFFNGSIPNNDLFIDSLGSQEIILLYSCDGTRENLWKAFGEFAFPFICNFSLSWYEPINKEDEEFVLSSIGTLYPKYGLLCGRF